MKLRRPEPEYSRRFDPSATVAISHHPPIGHSQKGCAYVDSAVKDNVAADARSPGCESVLLLEIEHLGGWHSSLRGSFRERDRTGHADTVPWHAAHFDECAVGCFEAAAATGDSTQANAPLKSDMALRTAALSRIALAFTAHPSSGREELFRKCTAGSIETERLILRGVLYRSGSDDRVTILGEPERRRDSCDECLAVSATYATFTRSTMIMNQE